MGQSWRRAWALAVLALAAPAAARAADPGPCEALTARYEARHSEMAPPEVSAALFSAADEGCQALAERVLAEGASVAARDRTGGTALTHAARGGNADLVKLLVGKGAEIDGRNVQGSTPLYAAAERDRLKAVEALVALGANVNLPGRSGVTPLAAAAYNGNLKLVGLLLDKGADPRLADASGKVPVIYAAARGFLPVVSRFLAGGLDVNAIYGNQLTLLMWAAGYANDVPADDGVKVVGLLLDKGAAVDARDDRGRTALMTAAALGHDEVVDLLLRHGADPSLRDKDGKAAADLAPSDALRARLVAARKP